jgi:hypothetical protein
MAASEIGGWGERARVLGWGPPEGGLRLRFGERGKRRYRQHERWSEVETGRHRRDLVRWIWINAARRLRAHEIAADLFCGEIAADICFLEIAADFGRVPNKSPFL